MHKYLLFLGTSLAVAQPALADDGEIVVTATGLAQPAESAPQSITVITRKEIEQVQGADVTRVLTRLPGTTFTRTGPMGGVTLIGVRGAPAGQTLVLIDGVPSGDPSTTGGEFDLAQLATGTIDSIELLRGPNSVVWGSQAMGGVMNITTRIENGVSGSVEYGGADRVTATAAAGLKGERFEAGVSGSFVDTDGYSAAANGTEKDGYRQYNIAGRARYRVTDALSLTANARYSQGKADLDGYPAPTYTFADTDATEKLRVWSGRIGAVYETEGLQLNAGYAITDSRREGRDPEDPWGNYTFKGRSERAELFGRVALPARFALNFGGAYDWSEFRNGFEEGKAENGSIHALLGYYGDRLVVTGGVRYDHHTDFGGEWTVGANASYEVVRDLRLRAAYGEGFKAPTLYQLLSQYGNPALSPERSKSYEVGLSYAERGAPVYAAITAYRRDASDLIDFFSCWTGNAPLCATRPDGFYYNVGKGRAQGLEMEVALQWTPTLTSNVVYSYVHTENRTVGDPNRGNRFARRPAHMITGSLDWETPIGLALGFDLRVVGSAWDDAANTTRLDSYALGDLRASYRVNDTVELFGRVENIWDQRYTIAGGYGTQGRAAYIGVRLRK